MFLSGVCFSFLGWGLEWSYHKGVKNLGLRLPGDSSNCIDNIDISS